MRRFCQFLYCVVLVSICLQAGSAQYDFKLDLVLGDTDIKSQGHSGTCWSFATVSFLESEIIRQSNVEVDLSEMFVVRHNYLDKARNYILRQGKASFGEGALSHDVTRVISEDGIVPESVYPGLKPGIDILDHTELVNVLKSTLDGFLEHRPVSGRWEEVVNAVLDIYLGDLPEAFKFDGRTYTAKSFASDIRIETDDYVSITSFNHHPFYEFFVLEIPDNFSNGSYFNVPLDQLQEVVDASLAEGYSVAWDGDVSSPGFESDYSIAVLPGDSKRADLFTNPGTEIAVDQENRQKGFETLVTTDDHLMHIVGKAHDLAGTTYYLVKNSWGIKGPANGYIYMSLAYFRMNTIAVMVNQHALPVEVADKLFSNPEH